MVNPTDKAEVSGRSFLTSHPWIDFRLDLKDMPWHFWERLGEARSKCRHLANTPLPPTMSERFLTLYLAKGAHATTAIEGNTLSEEQALEAIQGQLELPSSQQYLGDEIQNIVRACDHIEQEIFQRGQGFILTPERLSDLNRDVLLGLTVDDHVEPGQLRSGSVVVGGIYRGAPASDCSFLLETLCEWLNGPDFEQSEDGRETFLRAFSRAVIAHVYIAWIHPFGDGNGRTARLVEFGVLTAAGLPSVTAHLLSNHYNATRATYYRELDYASKSGGDLSRFLAYAAEGFVEQLQAQLDQVHGFNFEASWTNYVHEVFAGATTPATRRQRDLVLALRPGEQVPRARLDSLTPGLAAAYAGRGSKAITRDINALIERGLIARGPDGIRARREIMLGFLPQATQGNAL